MDRDSESLPVNGTWTTTNKDKEGFSVIKEITFTVPADFNVSKGGKVELDLGAVEVMGQVTLNGIEFDTLWMREHAVFIFKGITWTIIIAALSIVLACVLALLGALGRLSHNAIAVGVSGFYTSFFRGTPLIVQLFLIYLALPLLV